MINFRHALWLACCAVVALPTLSLAFAPATRTALSIKRFTAPPKASSSDDEYFNVEVNEFFKKPVPPFIKDYLAVKKESPPVKQDYSIVDIATAPPGDPGVPRPLWSVIFASLPSGLVWYGYYKFAVEEELLNMELSAGKEPRGFGGYGTLGPFSYGLILGPIAAIFHLPGGINWATAGIVYIYYTQFLLYDRVNELFKEEGLEPPLTVWWCWPIFFPFNLIVGLRQVHFLSQYFYQQRGVDPPPKDPVADFFPFIKAPKFKWQEFLTTPSLWCSLLANQENIDRSTLPEGVQDFLKIGEDETVLKKKR